MVTDNLRRSANRDRENGTSAFLSRRIYCRLVPTIISLGVGVMPAYASPWDGTWSLDLSHSSAMAKVGAARGYRFKIDPAGRIKWEIPALGEVVEGKTDGRPMSVHRPTATNGLNIAVRRGGPRTLIYEVRDRSGLQGGGRMVLIDGGAAWVDLTWGVGASTGYAFVYRKVSAERDS